MYEHSTTIGIKWGVKLTVTFEFAASANPCSISGTGNHQIEITTNTSKEATQNILKYQS